MKQRFKKLLAVLLTASLCIPAIPADAAKADASQSEIVWTDEEKVSATQISEDERYINFNEEWKFFLGDSSTAHEVNFIDASWDDVKLPHDFSITQDFTERGEAESGFLLGGTGWYRKKFSLPESFADKSIVLNFDGVYKDAEVYVNGTKVGEHHYGYSPFAFDISDYLTFDGVTENVIAVKAVNNIPSSRWYSGSGIYRDVTLIVTEAVHVDVNGTFVTTPNLATSNGSDGTVKIDVDVLNSSNASANVKVRNTIFEKGSDAAVATAEATVSLAADETKTVTANAKVNAPKIWSIDAPNLYTVQTEILQGDKVIDTYDTEFGFKWFEFVDDIGFKLNGQNVKINGVCMHHDQGALGSAAYYDATRRQMEIMKDMGVNTIRVTHNPASKVLMEICNELGLLVIEEFFDGWAWPKNGNSNDFSVYFRENLSEDNQIIGGSSSMTWAEFSLKSVVKRDRNDASLILWSLGNEIQEGTNDNSSWNWGEIADDLIKWTKDLDVTHPVTSGSNRRNTTDNIAPVTTKIVAAGGVAGYNYGDINSMNSLHNTYPVMLWSETASAINSRGVYTNQSTGTGAIGGHLTSYDESCVGWGKTAHASMYPVLSNDYIAGECVWTGFDYIGEPTPWNGTGTGIHGSAPDRNIAAPNSSYFGIVETTGFPKDNYYMYRSQWNQTANTLHLVTAWDPNNMKESNGKTPVWVYSNAAKVELYLNNQKIGTATRKSLDSTTTAAGHTRYEYTTESNNASVCTTSSGNGDQSLYSVFNVAFTAGTISAKAFDENGAEITNTCAGKSSVSTPGAASKLVASSDKESIDADGSSLSYITVDVTDADGNLTTKADKTINFSLSGEGEIVGVDNGDQASVDKYQQKSVLTDSKTAKIKSYAGKALVIVRSTKNGGSFTLDASSEGLTGASVTVQTKATGGATGSSIVNYTMSRHCYLPVGSAATAVSLPSTVKATLSDNTEKSFSVKWDAYDSKILNTKGNYRVEGTITNNDQTVNVSVMLHVYAPIIGVQNHSLCTAPNTIPTLPAVSMSYDMDGEPFAEYAITWNMNDITSSSFTEMNAIVPIEGTVNIFGKEYKTTASVRVAEPNIEYTNVATSRDHLVDNAFENGSNGNSYNDNLLAVTDGRRPDDGSSGSRWTDYGYRNNPEAQTNLQIAMDWATVTTTDMIDIYYFVGGGAVLPNAVKFEYAAASNYDETKKFLTAEWKEIPYSEPTDLPTTGLGTATVGKRYQLSELINPQAIRITFGHVGNSFMGVNEIEVMHPNYTYDLNSEASLTGATIGGKQVTFDDTTSIYAVDALSTTGDVTYENPNNAAVTVLKRGDSLMKIISVSEDGQSTKSYVITDSSNTATADDLSAFQEKLEEYKQIKITDLRKNGYSTLQNKIREYEAAINLMTKSDIATALDSLQAIFDIYNAGPWTITFDANATGVSNLPGDMSDLKDGQPASQPTTTPTRENYVFVGWSTEKDGAIYDWNTPITNNITLYAQWKFATYQITFDANGGANAPENISVEYGSTAVAPTKKPTRTNYVFVGWCTDKNGTAYDWKTPVTKDITLYAQWKLATRYINFNANGGTGAPSRIAVSHGSTAKQPTKKPTRKGYTFTGWTTTKNGSTVYNWSSKVTKDITLYAKWKANAPTITNGMKITDSKTKITYKVTNASKKIVMVYKGKNTKAKKVTIPDKVNLKGINFTVKEIGKNAFKGYTKMTELKIGKNVKTINKNAFYGCKKLKKVTFQATKTPSIKTGAFKKTASKVTVNVPKKMKSAQRKKLLKALKEAGMSKNSKVK